MRFGMSEKLGPRVFGHDHGQPFLGREFSAEPDYSDEIAREIDDEIRRIVETAHVQAKEILTEHRESLEKLSEILIKRETIEKEQFEALLDGQTEEEVFGSEAPPPPEVPAGHRRRPAERAGRDAPAARCRAPGWPAAPPSSSAPDDAPASRQRAQRASASTEWLTSCSVPCLGVSGGLRARRGGTRPGRGPSPGAACELRAARRTRAWRKSK